MQVTRETVNAPGCVTSVFQELQVEQPMVTELSVVVLQQEVVPPLFEGRACCETDAGCVFYDDGAGGGKSLQILP